MNALVLSTMYVDSIYVWMYYGLLAVCIRGTDHAQFCFAITGLLRGIWMHRYNARF